MKVKVEIGVVWWNGAGLVEGAGLGVEGAGLGVDGGVD